MLLTFVALFAACTAEPDPDIQAIVDAAVEEALATAAPTWTPTPLPAPVVVPPLRGAPIPTDVFRPVPTPRTPEFTLVPTHALAITPTPFPPPFASNVNRTPFDKYYDVPEVDPEWNQGRYFPRHCSFEGEYEGVVYHGVPMEEVPFKKEHVKEFYSDSEILNFVDNPIPHHLPKTGNGRVNCESDWEMNTHLMTNIGKGETAPRDLYGVSFYSRIFDFYSLWPTYQSGIWGQWIQSPNSPPYSAISSIEGGLGAYRKFGRSLYPKYMAGSATHFYNPNSSLFGWGFYERRVDCAFYGGIQITNKILSTPNSIAFDEDQKKYEENGGIFLGHGWFALPIFDGKERNINVSTTGPKDRHENTVESGKLTWTFFIESAQYE